MLIYSKKIFRFFLFAVSVFMFMPLINMYAANPPAPVGPVPSDRQVEWYHREQMGFIHFGINTFYNVEWGDGQEDPARFNPTSLDAAQWVKTFKDAGFTAIILVAKHHDGFCYWPSKYTTFSVASSPWKSGKGDEVKEVSDACKAAGIKLGIYLSPWDRHEKTYGTNAYNDYFNNQLTELLSNYGTIWETWFDGAGEAAGTYDWARWEKTIHTLQPNCIIWGTKTAYNYAEVRWVGNEGGSAGDPCFSTIDPSNIQVENTSILNSGQANGSAFIPAETNTSIRPGWFYHSSEDGSVKSVDTLWNYYFTSVGHNTVMLLNIPPDTRGLMNSTDVNNVSGMYSRIYNTFSSNLASGSTVTASDTRGTDFSPQNLIDNDENTYYASSDGVTTPTITFALNGNKTFDCVMLQEVIKLGERVTGWAVDAYYNNTWNTLATKQCIGYKWIERFNSVTASSVRLRITSAKACPAIHTFGIYLRSSGGSLPTPTPVVSTRSAFSQIEAESFNSNNGTVKAETCSDTGGGQNLGYISNGDWVCYNNIDFGSGATSFQARVASTVTTGKIYVRVDTPTGTQIGTLTGPNTGNSQTYTTVTIPVTNTSGNIVGVHDLYLYFDAWVNLNWFAFSASTETPGPTAETVTLGDANGNGTIDIVDALLIAQYYVGLNPAGFVAANADVNCSGAVDIVDALLVAQYYVGLIARFC
jgi:alpha-L-fucosidase